MAIWSDDYPRLIRILAGICVFAGLHAVPHRATAQTLLERFERRLRDSEITPPESLLPPQATTRTNRAPNPVQLGVVAASVTPTAIQEYGLQVRQGALVTRVEPDSPASQAGLTVGSVIVAVDGVRIDAPSELVRAIQSSQQGQVIELAYYEGRQLKRQTVKLSANGAAPLPAGELPPPDPQPESAPSPLPPRDAGEVPPATSPDNSPQRPLLNRLGQVLDELVIGDSQVAPASGTAPLPAVPADSTEIERLRSQVEQLQRQLELVTKRLAEVEQKLGAE